MSSFNQQSFQLNGKVALITGGASGLGKATADRMLRSNANVVIADYNEKEGRRVAEELNAKYSMTCLFIKTDVSQEAEVKAAVDFAVEKFGHLDILVASAGIGGDNCAIAEETLENWNRVNSIDYTGVMLADKYAIMQFRKQGNGGAVVNLASMFGLVAVPSNIAYSAAKGGVVNLTKSAGAAYAGEGIRVNCVCPGVINTPLVPESEKEVYRALHPMRRIGEDFEIASIITFLCCDNARFITGAAIPVDGGYTSV
ncbi:MAG: SDR family oxidoreductase, partial [Limosilactobacillus mucosae]|nr:SDR family oxidoreductase [Limosilactobacillus mucosae]